MSAIVLNRSVLYTPGANPVVMNKALNGAADVLIFDLEDAVAPDAKGAARSHVVDVLAQAGAHAAKVVVRVNDLDSAWCDADVRAAVGSGATAILFPKISSVDHVRRAHDLLNKYDAAPDLKLWCMIETPLAILNVQAIAQQSLIDDNRMTTWVLGTNDLVKDLRAAHVPGRANLLTALSMAVLAARAYGLIVLDGVHNDIKDEDAFLQNCQQAREMGFDGKTLIHPAQIVPCHAVFSPSEQDIVQARKIIEAFALPENKDKGVLKVEGQMVELLHAQIAASTLAMADAIASSGR